MFGTDPHQWDTVFGLSSLTLRETKLKYRKFCMIRDFTQVTKKKRLKELACLVYKKGDQKGYKSLLCQMSVFK